MVFFCIAMFLLAVFCDFYPKWKENQRKEAVLSLVILSIGLIYGITASLDFPWINPIYSISRFL